MSARPIACLPFALRLPCLPLGLALALGCGGSTPPPKTDEAPSEEGPKKPRGGGGAPSVSQELGSIDQRAVEVTFDKLQGKLETCHKKGRDKVEYLAGDVKVFLRVGQDGRVRYGFFEESTVGDRDTEKCVLDLFAATDWPKPQGGEAEVRNGFGWSAGGERQPASWPAEKVSSALEDDKDVKKNVDACKSGVSGTFKVTAYVEPGEPEGAKAEEPKAAAGKPNGKGPKGGTKGGEKKPAKEKEHGGKFKAIGVAPPGKEGADKLDCLVDALKPLSLPSPGSYAAKVTFSL